MHMLWVKLIKRVNAAQIYTVDVGLRKGKFVLIFYQSFVVFIYLSIKILQFIPTLRKIFVIMREKFNYNAI